MEIRQTRIVLRADSFEATTRFYEQVLGFPRLNSWDGEDGRRVLFQAGTAVVEILGRSRQGESGPRDEPYDYQGPNHEVTLEVVVPSAEDAYQELLFRDRNIPGGLLHEESGDLLFATHDPDGVRIVFREVAG